MPNHIKGSLKGTIQVPGDKSISHRAIMFGSLAEGTTEITNFLPGADCLSTLQCFRQLGVDIQYNSAENRVTVHGNGLYGLKEPRDILDVGNSGTTMRLMAGILSGQSFPSILTGDESIQTRPMNRIMIPLKEMGADIRSQQEGACAPLLINSTSVNIDRDDSSPASDARKTDAGEVNPGNENKSPHLKGIHYNSPVASAQVKSCILLAGLYAEGETSVTEPALSRNHTELMLAEFGATLKSEGNTVTIEPEPHLTGRSIAVPGDISSAAYFIAAGLIVPDSELRIQNVGINPTRDGILRICKQMGANIRMENIKTISGEATADLIVRHSQLIGTEIGGDIIPTLIDEIPIIAVLACFAEGETIIKDAAELKVKESNRIDLIVDNLARMGADITATEDGMIIRGGRPLHGAEIESKADHRIAMAFAIAALMAEGNTQVSKPGCVTISYPEFYKDLKRIQRP